MTTYMKQTLRFTNTPHNKRTLNPLTGFRMLVRTRPHMDSIDPTSLRQSIAISQEAEEMIRAFRQKHFKD
jgi:hypothetical protein